MADLAVVLMAYGSPTRPEDVEPYLTDIRGGEKPSPEAVADLERRYRAIGGRSPLNDITERTARALEKRLRTGGTDTRVFVGMRHWHPFIRETVEGIGRGGYHHILGIALAPHYSRGSVGAYEEALRSAASISAPAANVAMVREWHLHPRFLDAWAKAIAAARAHTPFSDDNSIVLFSAHSLPERIASEGDLYPTQLLETSEALARRLGLRRWDFAYQSAGSRGVWLGPRIGDRIDELARAGVRAIVSAPIGFVSDHLEVLYDLDIAVRGRCEAAGVAWTRPQMPNDSADLVDALADCVSFPGEPESKS